MTPYHDHHLLRSSLDAGIPGFRPRITLPPSSSLNILDIISRPQFALTSLLLLKHLRNRFFLAEGLEPLKGEQRPRSAFDGIIGAGVTMGEPICVIQTRPRQLQPRGGVPALLDPLVFLDRSIPLVVGLGEGHEGPGALPSQGRGTRHGAREGRQHPAQVSRHH